jgi:hypothetical protein
VKPFKIRIPTRKDWQMRDKINPKVDVGSQIGWEFMTALVQVFLDPYITRESIPMGSLSTVFSAELMAILMCTELLLTRNPMRRRIHICCSRAVIAKTTTESSLVWECMQVLGKLKSIQQSHLGWMPRQQGILGNEEADRLAKEGLLKSH